MDIKVHQYLQFLRFCLDVVHQPIPECVRYIRWSELLEFAKKQTIVGLYWQGIQQLENLPYNKPSEDDVMTWMGEVMKLKRKNRRINSVAVDVSKKFKHLGYNVCILKGQGNATMYPEPELRTPGDIDILLGRDGKIGHKKTVHDIIAFCKKLFPTAKATYHHIDFQEIDGVPIEVHYRPSWLSNPIANYHLQQYFTEHSAQFFNRESNIGEGESIPIPETSCNVVFQLSHIYKHLLQEGIGFRQIIDFYYLLKSERLTEKEVDCLREIIAYCNLQKIASGVFWVLDEILGLEKSFIYIKPNNRYGQMLLREILAAGNFGKYDNRALSGFYKTALKANTQKLYRDVRMSFFFPSECISEPFFRIFHAVWRWKYHKG